MDMRDKIILASSSPRRRELLSQIGLDFTVDAADIDENLRIEDPALLVEELSLKKALAVAAKHPDSVILGADTVVTVGAAADSEDALTEFLDGSGSLSGSDSADAPKILGKPRDAADAARMLSFLSGKTHTVLTGVTMLKTDGAGTVSSQFTFHEATDVTFFELSEREIEDYIATGEPLDKAGAYGIQGRGLLLVKEIRGDYCNVVGLPVSRLCRELRRIKNEC